MLLLTKELRRKLPPLYSQEKNPDPTVYIKFFHPCSSWTWYATEFDGQDQFFGFVDGTYGEWGFFSLAELQSLKAAGSGIERDLYFEPKPFSEVKKTEVMRGQ